MTTGLNSPARERQVVESDPADANAPQPSLGDPPEPDPGINEERPDQGYWADATGPAVRLKTALRLRAT